MEVYRRITERVRGSLWAHHRRLMPERQFHRILAYVYNNKYEYQIQFDKMECVGKEWEGKVEVVTTPAGYIKRIRVNPSVQDLPPPQRKALLMSAYAKACKEGRTLMQQAELRVYKQFLQDLKPIVLGVRDNPEFYTVDEDGTTETVGGTLRNGTGKKDRARTIPFAKAYQPSHEVERRSLRVQNFLATDEGRQWARTVEGKDFLREHPTLTATLPKHLLPQDVVLPKGAPGPKKAPKPLELLAPYTPMDEGRLQTRNWMAYLDNKHVAETMWTRAKVAEREKRLRHLQEKGQAWHSPINPEAVTRY